MRCKLIGRMVVVLCLAVAIARADSLELKNGSLIKGRFIGGTETVISFQVESSVQKYNIADIVSLRFDSDQIAGEVLASPYSSRSSRAGTADHDKEAPALVTIPAGTHIVVRTIDGIDSTKNHAGDQFQASLEEPLTVDGNVIIAKGADVYGRLAESKTSGTFTGRSELRLELTSVVVNGQTVSVVTGDYELTGKSKGASTAKRTVGGAAVGTIIGALAGGGKGAAIGAGAGAGVGVGSEIITRGDQVKVPSETLLDFTLQQNATIPTRPI